MLKFLEIVDIIYKLFSSIGIFILACCIAIIIVYFITEEARERKEEKRFEKNSRKGDVQNE